MNSKFSPVYSLPKELREEHFFPYSYASEYLQKHLMSEICSATNNMLTIFLLLKFLFLILNTVDITLRQVL